MTKIRIALQSWYVKAKSMKVSQAGGCLLLFATLVSFRNCDRDPAQRLAITPMPVSITKCTPSADPIQVKSSHPVIWKATDRAYAITFKTKYDPHGNNITPPSPSFTTATATWDTTNTPYGCGDTIGNIAGCLFKYNIFYVTNGVPDPKPCNDPGVHIQPGP